MAIDDGVVVGFVSAVHYLHLDKPQPELWINEVSVAPDRGRLGLGRELLRRLLEHGAQIDCTEAWLLTHRSNVVAMKLYESAGGIAAEEDQVMFAFLLNR